MKRTLVTGGAGFLGSHLAERLLAGGNEVLVLDNFSNGDPDNIRHLLGKKGFKLLRADVRDRVAMGQAMQNIDIVFHLAAQIHVDKSIIDPKETISVNVDGTLAVLDVAMQNDVEKIIVASSSEVYGTAQTSKISEEHPLNGSSPYAASKTAADRPAYSYWSTYGLDVTIIRAFNTFGPRQKSSGYGGVIGIFMERAALGLPPVIYGDGLQTRDYLYVKDTIKAYELLMNSKKTTGKAINFGSGTDTSILEIAEKIYAIMGRPDLKPVHIEPRPGEVRRLIADSSLAKRLLGFKPSYTLDEGLKEYAKWFPSHGFRQWAKSG